MKTIFLVLALLFIVFTAVSHSLAVEKLKFATVLRVYPPYNLPVFAAEDKGFWKQNGLEVEWVPFRGSVETIQALAAGSINIVGGAVGAMMQAAERGVSVIAVAGLDKRDPYLVWVASGSQLKEPKDLKGARMGVSRIGGLDYAYTQIVLKGLGLEKEIKFVGVGGIPESVAALKTGSIDATVRSIYTFANLKVEGEVRELVNVEDHLPKDWFSSVIYARKDFIKANPDVVRRAVRAMIQGADYVTKDKGWAIEKMKKDQQYSEQAATLIYGVLNYVKDGKIDRKGLENVRNFLIEQNQLSKEKTPPVDELYTEEFIR